MSGEIIIVAGLGRCGTSLVMQMLAAAGLSTVGTFPDFENEAAERERAAAPNEWLARCAGRAVKVLDPQRVPPPPSACYRAIWLTRDIEQQARSQLKLIGEPPSRAARRGMAQSLRRDEPRGLQAVRALGCAILHLRFEYILAEPRLAAERIAGFVGYDILHPITVARMVGAVIPRRPACLPGMLENHLLAGAA